MISFKTLYGRLPLVCIAYESGSSSNKFVDIELKERDEVLMQLKKNLDRAQEQIKKYFNKGMNMESFEQGE